MSWAVRAKRYRLEEEKRKKAQKEIEADIKKQIEELKIDTRFKVLETRLLVAENLAKAALAK